MATSRRVCRKSLEKSLLTLYENTVKYIPEPPET
jgi:hypothetical protein